MAIGSKEVWCSCWKYNEQGGYCHFNFLTSSKCASTGQAKQIFEIRNALKLQIYKCIVILIVVFKLINGETETLYFLSYLHLSHHQVLQAIYSWMLERVFGDQMTLLTKNQLGLGRDAGSGNLFSGSWICLRTVCIWWWIQRRNFTKHCIITMI